MTGQLQLSAPIAGTVNAAAGKVAKTDGIARVRQLDPEWAAQCDEAIRTMASRGVIFQAADLIAEELVGEPPHPNCWGARFATAARAGVIEAAVPTKSKRATVHRSLCNSWQGTAAYRAEVAA
ncbi:hypothetical protein [Streptomyces sp. NPDC056242]|uniref:hypothetical protein n=1 Tax=Streptomyces sp. NPDC056242 TaxID=3345760 RepID=UPI0035E317B5